jgi:hypothetical protein
MPQAGIEVVQEQEGLQQSQYRLPQPLPVEPVMAGLVAPGPPTSVVPLAEVPPVALLPPALVPPVLLEPPFAVVPPVTGPLQRPQVLSQN